MLGAALLGGGALGANLSARPEAHVCIGAPIPLAGYQDKDGQERLTADLHARMVELKREAVSP